MLAYNTSKLLLADIISATDDPVAWCVSLSLCQSVTLLNCAKPAERIDVLFGVEPRHIALNWSFDIPTRGERGC